MEPAKMTNKHDSESISDASASLERLQLGLLEAFGGQDLRNSGFENEEPDPEFAKREEPWRS
jgi:hypothetical protein